MKHGLKKRILSLVLCISMVLPMAAVPMPVYSVENEESIAPLSNPFTPETIVTLPDGTSAKSQSYRIPSMVTLADGTIVAAADIRWNTTYDGGGLDTLVAKSTDGGKTWKYKVANYLGDNGNEYDPQSTTFIDPNLLVAADGQTVYMLVDLYAYGIALNGRWKDGAQEFTYPAADTGFDANGKLKLSDDNHYSYNYYLKDGKIYDSSNNVVKGYEVDAYFNISYTQNGVVKESNLFFADSPFKVARTQYLYLTKSTDGGESWSEPTLLDVRAKSRVPANEDALLVAPGNSITTSKGIMVYPAYSYTSNAQYVSLIYSVDGVNWERTANYTGLGFSSEGSIVELKNGNLRVFVRNKTGYLCYVDFDMDTMTWSGHTETTVPTNSNTQLSAISYSKTFDGNQVILVSCPTGPNSNGSSNNDGSYRTNGKIFVGVVAEDGKMSWPESIDVAPYKATAQLQGSNYTEDQGFFAYSSLTERADGSLMLLYENNQFGWGAGDDKYYTINAKAYSESDLGITFDSNEVDTREKDGITVTGYIPRAVELQVSGVSDDKVNAVSNGLIDNSGFSEILTISGKDITLLDKNTGLPWHPGADRPVTVNISNVWTPGGKKMPSVDVYHILDDMDAVSRAQAGGYLLTCTDPDVLALYPQEASLLDGTAVPYVRLPGIDGGAVVNQDGSVSFKTDSFSDYFIVLGFTDGLSLSNNGNDTYHVEPGTTLTFKRNVTWTPQGTVPNGITANGSQITISSSVAVPSEVVYTASWTGSGLWGSSGGSATITIKVATRNQIISGALSDEKYPIILSVMQGITSIPSEPGHTNGDYYHINANYQSNQSYPPRYMFSPTAEGIISPAISNLLTKSIDSSNTIGYADASGASILRNLSGIDWDKILDRAISNGWKAIDGTTLTSSNKSLYKVVPYVVKLMDGSNYSGKGWHIDCAIVKKDNVTLSYDINLDNYQVSSITLPVTASGIPPFTTNVGSITYGSSKLNVGSTIRATYGDEQMDLTFEGWNTSPDGTGTMYTPSESVTIDKDTTLYAIWNGQLAPGELYIYKNVTADEGVSEPVGTTYQFNIQFGTAGTYSYTVYNADGSTAATGSTNMQGAIYLANGQYAVFTDVPANTTYTVTENEGVYTTSSEGSYGAIRSGGRAVARFTNHYAYIEPEVTINYVAKDGGSVTVSTETVKVNNGNAQGSDATPNSGYRFVGWFLDEACTKAVEASWITSGNHLTPQKIDSAYQAATYYAKFEPDTTSLTISKTGHYDIDENQTFLFQITGENVDLIVTVHGNGSATVNGLKVGSEYRVTELTDWSWRYEFSAWVFTSEDTDSRSGKENNASVTLGSSGNQIIFTNTRSENKWLDGDNWLDNLFKGN